MNLHFWITFVTSEFKAWVASQNSSCPSNAAIRSTATLSSRVLLRVLCLEGGKQSTSLEDNAGGLAEDLGFVKVI